MKRLFNLIFAILLLTGCGKSFQYNHETLKDEVIKVEIINIEIIDSKRVFTTLIEFDSLTEFDNLLENLSKLKFNSTFANPSNLSGNCIKLFYENSNYDIISHRIIMKYDSNDINIQMLNKRCSEKDFNDLITHYFENI